MHRAAQPFDFVSGSAASSEQAGETPGDRGHGVLARAGDSRDQPCHWLPMITASHSTLCGHLPCGPGWSVWPLEHGRMMAGHFRDSYRKQYSFRLLHSVPLSGNTFSRQSQLAYHEKAREQGTEASCQEPHCPPGPLKYSDGSSLAHRLTATSQESQAHLPWSWAARSWFLDIL